MLFYRKMSEPDNWLAFNFVPENMNIAVEFC